jgi:CSLREA domain-containing protein
MTGTTDMSVSRYSAKRLHPAAVALLVFWGAIGVLAPAEAAAIGVTTTSDELNGSPPCSLREAIRAANTDTPIGGCAAGSGADTINLPAGIYHLGIANSVDPDENLALTGDLDVVSNITLVGSGEAATVVDGNGAVLADRVFDVSASAIAAFDGLTIRNGNSPTSAAGGGAISNDGRATFRDATIVGNSAGAGGGAVSNGAGAISEFFDSTVSGNVAGGSGAGIRNGSGASSTFTNTTISGNAALVGGGGVSNDGVATFTNSTVSGNIAGGRGGGVFNGTPVATATFTNTTISGNAAQGEGGGISNGSGATSTMVNSTVSGNRTADFGGGVHGGTSSLSNSTVTVNTADSDANGTGDGGGVALTTMTVKNSVIAGNVDGSPSPAPIAPDCQAVLTSQGYNLIGNDTGCTITAGLGDKVGSGAVPIDPGLAPLRNYGGPTATHALLAFSPARNSGSPAASDTGGDSCIGTDQRGVPRPQNSRCDVGAYEYAACLKAVVDQVGTSGNDTLAGTSGPDVFLGLGGKDRIKGRGGKDRACGGKGKDPLIGGSGADRLAGDEGADRLFGGLGSDQLMGGRGNDLLVGGGGWDRCVGGPGRDRAISCEKEIGIP